MARAAPWHRTRACKFERADQTPDDKCEDPTSPRLLGNSELEAGGTGQDFRTLVGAHVKGVQGAQSSFWCTLTSVPCAPAQKTSTGSIDNPPQLTTSHEKAEDCEVALLWGCGATFRFFCRHWPVPSLQALVLWTLGALGRFGTLGCGTACRSCAGRPGREARARLTERQHLLTVRIDALVFCKGLTAESTSKGNGASTRGETHAATTLFVSGRPNRRPSLSPSSLAAALRLTSALIGKSLARTGAETRGSRDRFDTSDLRL